VCRSQESCPSAAGSLSADAARINLGKTLPDRVSQSGRGCWHDPSLKNCASKYKSSVDPLPEMSQLARSMAELLNIEEFLEISIQH